MKFIENNLNVDFLDEVEYNFLGNLIITKVVGYLPSGNFVIILRDKDPGWRMSQKSNGTYHPSVNEKNMLWAVSPGSIRLRTIKYNNYDIY